MSHLDELDCGTTLPMELTRSLMTSPRRQPRWCPVVLMLAVWWVWGGTAVADPVADRFLQGLRQREYFDTSLDYLTLLEQDPRSSPETRHRTRFERGMILRDWSTRQSSMDRTLSMQHQAQQEFVEFLRQAPDHPLVSQASCELGKLLRVEGKSVSQQAQRQISVERRDQQLAESRKLFQASRVALQKTRERQERAFQAFPKFIDKAQDPQKFSERAAVESLLVEARLHLVILTFEEALVAEATQRKEKLEQCQAEADALYQSYRSQLAGLYARLYQGRALQELKQPRKGLGIFQELILMRVEDPNVVGLQDEARHYRLQIWNSDAEKKSDQVVQDATAWIKANRERTRTAAGQGIRWELARAHEALGKVKNVSTDQQESQYQRALAIARELAQQSGEYQLGARNMFSRLNLALNREVAEPKDFEAAYDACSDTIRMLQGLQDSLEQADTEAEKTRMRDDLSLQLQNGMRQLQQTLALRRADSPAEEVCRIRYWLCHVYFLTDRLEEASILGEFLARRFHHDQKLGTMPLDAAYLAMAAYTQEYNSAHNADKGYEVQQMIQLCNFLIATWPKEAKAEEAMLMLGRLYSEIDDPESAARWFDRIPPQSPFALEAQLSAGTAYWNAYLNFQKGTSKSSGGGTLAKKGQMNPDQYPQLAHKKLLDGIQSEDRKADSDTPLSSPVRIARLTLAQIENERGNYQEARKLLYSGRRSLLQGADKAPLEPSAGAGPGGREFLVEAYRQWLRAAIGLQNLEESQWAIQGLEHVQGNATDLYVPLGNQFQQELQRLKGTNETQWLAVLSSFEAFLKRLMAHEKEHNFSTLAWLGESWLKLAENSQDSAQAKPCLEQAIQIFETALRRGDQEANFLKPEQRLAIEFRLLSCRRRAGDFERAFEACQVLLKRKPQSLELQTEGARIFEDWAQTGGDQALSRWRTSLQGMTTPSEPTVSLWGWAGIAQRLSRQLEANSAPEMGELMLEARYHVVLCRLRGALHESVAEERNRELQRAAADAQYTSTLRTLDDHWYERFNGLWHEIQQARGEQLTNLPRQQGDGTTSDAAPSPQVPAAVAGPISQGEKGNSSSSFVLPIVWVAFGVTTILIVLSVIYLNRPRRQHKSRLPQRLPPTRFS